jgi:hypothetical protein
LLLLLPPLEEEEEEEFIFTAGNDSRRLDGATPPPPASLKRTDGDALLTGAFSPLGATAIDLRRLLVGILRCNK